MPRRSAGTSDQPDWFGSTAVQTEVSNPDLVSISLSYPDEVSAGGDATIVATIENTASYVAVSDPDYCEAGQKALGGKISGYDVTITAERDDAGQISPEGVRAEANDDPLDAGGGGSPVVVDLDCIATNSSIERQYTVETPEPDTIRGTVTVEGFISGNVLGSAEYDIDVLDASRGPDRDTTGDSDDETPPEEDDSNNNDNGDNNNPDPEEPSGLTEFWNARSDGEKALLVLGGVGALAALGGQGG